MLVTNDTCLELSTLLRYPWETPVIEGPELRKQLKPLVTFFEREPLAAVQELFTTSFDLGPSLVPYLGFHMHGETYRRGMVMARLRAVLQRYEVDEEGELPDHLGPILRLLATAGPDPELDELVKTELKPGLDKLIAEAAKSDSDNPYRSLLTAAARAMEERIK